MMRRMFDPGLPSSPWLYFDEERGEAYVSTRVTDWRAIERGYQATRVFMVSCYFGIVFGLWSVVPSVDGLTGEDVMVWVATVLITFGIVIRVASPLIWQFMPRSISEALFSRKLKFFFTAKAIGFRSCYYANGVRIGRTFCGMPVQIKVTLKVDPEAEDFAEYVSVTVPGKTPRKWPKNHFRHARWLELVIVGSSGNTPQIEPSGPRCLRALPVASIPLSQAEPLTVVLNAAIAITQAGMETSQRFQAPIGMDLDHPHSSRR